MRRRLRSCSTLGTIHRLQSRWEQALRVFQEALDRFRSLDDRAGQARALSNLGLVLRKLNDIDAARDAFQQSVELWGALPESGDQRFGLARGLNNLGMTLRDERQYDEARAAFDQALELRHAIGDADGVSRLLSNLGQLALREGDPDEADGCSPKLSMCDARSATSTGLRGPGGNSRLLSSRVGRRTRPVRLLRRRWQSPSTWRPLRRDPDGRAARPGAGSRQRYRAGTRHAAFVSRCRIGTQ